MPHFPSQCLLQLSLKKECYQNKSYQYLSGHPRYLKKAEISWDLRWKNKICLVFRTEFSYIQILFCTNNNEVNAAKLLGIQRLYYTMKNVGLL